jgi:hypothetical protein
VLITLSRLSPFIAKNASSIVLPTKTKKKDSAGQATVTEDVVFSDAAISDESSEEEGEEDT